MTPRCTPLVLTVLALVSACSTGPPPPAPLDTQNEMCAFCRMAVSEARFAAQLVAPAETPLFFDDIGCLAGYLSKHPALPGRAMAYVADHRTGAWVPAADAVYTKRAEIQTPMGSHIVAHASSASRDDDPAAKGGEAVPLTTLFGPAGPPTGASR